MMNQQDKDYLQALLQGVSAKIMAGNDLNTEQHNQIMEKVHDIISRQDVANGRTEKLERRLETISKETRFARWMQKKWMIALALGVIFVLVVHEFIGWNLILKLLEKLIAS